MPTNPYTVETRAQGALILTGSDQLTSAIAHRFTALGLDPLQDVSRLDAYLSDHDLDYVLVVLTPELGAWISQGGREVWDQILSAGEGGNFVIATHSWDRISVELPENARLVSLGEYLDAGGAPTLNRLLTEAHTSSTLTLPGDGLEEYSLLSLSDLSLALVHASTSPTWDNHELIIANPETLSLHGLAHLITTSFAKQVKIIFGGERLISTPHYDWKPIILSHAKYGIVLSGDIHDALVKYLHSFRSLDKPAAPPVAPPPSQPNHPRLTPITRVVTKIQSHGKGLVFVPIKPTPWKAPILSRAHHPIRNIVLRGLAIALAIYVGSLAFATTIVALHLRALSAAVESGDIARLKAPLITKYSALYLETNLVAVAPSSDAASLMDLYIQGLGVLETTSNLSLAAKNISSYVLTDQGGDIASYFSHARLYTEELYQRVSLLDGAMPPSAPDLISSHQSKYTQLKTTLNTLKKNLITGKALLAIAPDFIALGTRAKYAVLFQNNMELRATGGFIGSFAVLSFENGKLYDMPVYDVYAADGQLKGHVEPPGPIKDILGEANWYLRDSNFDPDFPTSARRAEWFIKKTMNIDVDGTIAITLDLLKYLLQATGPLELPDYQETVSASNIYERAQFHAEVNFFPGSQAKKEFLSSVADALFAKVQGGGGGDTLKLLAVLAASVDSKNVQISSLDPQIEHVMSALSWNGQLVEHPCPGGGTCVQDYAYLVDSNFGVNKANYYVSRDLSMLATVGKEGTLAHVFTARYKNSATSSAWPAGPYKNYARLYLPFGSQIESVRVGDKTLDTSELTLTEEHGKLVLAFLLTVPINSQVVVEARYTTPQTIKGGSLYTWYWQKQPGTPIFEPLSVTLNYPLFLNPEVISPEGELAPQSLHFDFQNDADHRVTVKFAQ